MVASTLDTLIGQVADERLRVELRAAAADLRKLTEFGLVFESHIPETVRLPHHPIRVGVMVACKDGTDSSIFEVVKVNGAKVTMRRFRSADGSALSAQQRAKAEDETTALDALVAIAEFGEPIYPGLRHLGSVSRGGDRSAHVVINGENHHALQALQFTHAGKVDCIYIDPPYNSGARDWKYSNDYVDDVDQYRHSKWLAFMERRLILAQQLLKPDDSVLVVTIDENEVHHLGLLLEQIFPTATRQLVSIVNNPKGVTRTTLSRVEEYAVFCFVGAASASSISDDLLTPGADEIVEGIDVRPRWKGLLRSGANSKREQHPTFFYPVLVDPRTYRIVGAGASPPDEVEPDREARVDGKIAVWPVRSDGTWGRWMLKPRTLRTWADLGYVALGQRDERRMTWGISYLTSEPQAQIVSGFLEIRDRDPETGVVDVVYANKGSQSRRVKTVWHRTNHDAGVGGTAVVEGLLGERAFEYPKSVYAVRDTLDMLTRHKPDAVILDFFAGSGTTLHATAMLNAQDGGRRRSILVTNNEVGIATQTTLRAQGLRPGDADWEREGIFEHVTRPRVEAAVFGNRPDGTPITARLKNADGSLMSDGFEENVEFFELTYLDAGQVEVNLAFAGIAPLLWLRAGGRGPIIEECVDGVGRRMPYSWTDRYGVLFNCDRWRSFVTKLPETATTVYIVTDSNTEFAHIAGELPVRLDVVRLYERYLTTFGINERQG